MEREVRLLHAQPEKERRRAVRSRETTTSLLEHAPFGAVFVCASGHTVEYAEHLTRVLRRPDILVVGQEFIRPDRLRESQERAIVLDHAVRLTAGQTRSLELYNARRSELYGQKKKGGAR